MFLFTIYPTFRFASTIAIYVPKRLVSIPAVMFFFKISCTPKRPFPSSTFDSNLVQLPHGIVKCTRRNCVMV
ncbi:hypothetical protein VNO77_19753 [Canavalia gladiata]|uniref:Uncharacterized protein n=1 Tax=Canavalia gladiata TaxID=3824 RepID=A0AAN9QKQ4_CANGL